MRVKEIQQNGHVIKTTYQGAKNSTKTASCSLTLPSKSGPDKSNTSLDTTTEIKDPKQINNQYIFNC